MASNGGFAENSADYEPLIARKVNQALMKLLDDPEHFEDHNKMYVPLNSSPPFPVAFGRFAHPGVRIGVTRLSISIPIVTMYGYDVKSFKDPVIASVDESITLSVALVAPGGCLMNIIPILRNVLAWFPGRLDVEWRIGRRSSAM